MVVKGLLIGIRRFDFPDKDTGELIQGAKVVLGVEPEGRQRNDIAGYVVQDIRANFKDFDALAAEAKGLEGQHVAVACDVTLRGRYTNLVARSISAETAKLKAAS